MPAERACASWEGGSGNLKHEVRLVKWAVPSGARTETVSFSVFPNVVSVSDDGAWIAVVSTENPIGDNADGSSELFLVSSDGATVRQLTDHPSQRHGFVSNAAIAGGGTVVAYLDSGDPLGTNASNLTQLFSVAADGTGRKQLTSIAADDRSFFGLSLDDAGTRVAFASDADLLSTNGDGNAELYAIDVDGTALAQLTSGTDSVRKPFYSGNGSKIVFELASNVAIVNAAGGTTLILDSGSHPTINDLANLVFHTGFDASSDSQLKRILATGGTGQNLTATTSPVSYSRVIVSGGSGRLLAVVDGDQSTGANADASPTSLPYAPTPRSRATAAANLVLGFRRSISSRPRRTRVFATAMRSVCARIRPRLRQRRSPRYSVRLLFCENFSHCGGPVNGEDRGESPLTTDPPLRFQTHGLRVSSDDRRTVSSIVSLFHGVGKDREHRLSRDAVLSIELHHRFHHLGRWRFGLRRRDLLACGRFGELPNVLVQACWREQQKDPHRFRQDLELMPDPPPHEQKVAGRELELSVRRLSPAQVRLADGFRVTSTKTLSFRG